MTSVIAYKFKNNIIMMSDSCGSTSYQKNVFTQEKCFKFGKLKIGFCGSFAAGQALFYSKELKKLKKTNQETIDDFVFNKVIPLIKKLVENIDTEESDFIIAYDDRFFVIDGIDFSMLEDSNGYTAIGSGEHILIGAVEIMGKENFEKDLENNLYHVMKLIEKHHTGVSQPFKLLK